MEYRKIQKKNCQQSKRAIWTRWVVIGLLLATTILDFFTFAIEPKFWVYDISPLVALTKNILILFSVKFLVVGLLIFMLLKKSYNNDYARYLWILCAVYLIFAQGVGAVSNRQVVAQNPDPIKNPPPPAKEMAKIGFNFALLYAYYPLAFSMLGFWIWQWGWRND